MPSRRVPIGLARRLVWAATLLLALVYYLVLGAVFLWCVAADGLAWLWAMLRQAAGQGRAAKPSRRPGTRKRKRASA